MTPPSTVPRDTRRTPVTFAVMIAFALTLASCTSDPSPGPNPVARVTVTPRLVSLGALATMQLTAQAFDAAGKQVTGATVGWSAAEPNVAVVSASGLVTAIGPGTTAIQAKAGNVSGFAAITVNAAVGTVLVFGVPGTLSVGNTRQLSASTLDPSGNQLFLRSITWTSSAPTVATVASTGLVTALGPGSATITATSEGRSGSTIVTVVAAGVATISLLPPTVQLIVGGARQLVATVKDATGRVLTDRLLIWISSDATLATVSQSGLVTTLAPGATTISARAEARTGASVITALNGLASNIPVALSAPVDVSHYFYVNVPSGTRTLIVSTSGGTGDPDLYVYLPGATPSDAGDAECQSNSDGPGELCTISAPTPGLWMVEVLAFSAYSGLQLKVQLVP